ncbi:Hint domain-containing protein [Acetobacter senegalensis]|uniref:Hint domain-containing protein n=1 Tax=Acetobacter senegalensis TaxID=446692 RepID=UPI001EDA418E|nr:Hint domain-containing protein [Acetobacter senegalensis]MCG4252716.1 Hint domain-containing protein [Acetobacter senegalensis]
MTTTIQSSVEWDTAYDNQDVAVDGTSSPITVNIVARDYGSWKEGDTANTPFHSPNMTISGNVTLTGDGYLNVNSTLTNNGSLTIETTNFAINGTLTGKNVTIANGGSLTVGTLKAPVTFGASPSAETEYNTLTITNYAASGVLTLNNLSPRDKIVFDNGQSTSLQWGDDGKTIIDQNGTVLASVTFAEGYNKDNYNFNGNTVTITCFLAGSMIRTANGDVAVEDITIGDQVVAFDWKNNRNILRSVVWVGTARAVVQPHLADDEAGWPVRVLKDAIADGVPYKDMLITAEHCLFFEDRFVPVRMLVNGRTIFYDKSILSYDYYHVETELHSVITADGMLTESYLDTGNRSSFRQDGKVATLRGTARSWQDDAGAPLCVDRSFVQPLFHVLEHREKSVEQALPAPEKAALVHDADLHLVTDKGATLRPVRHRDEQYSFMLPSGTQSVRILSRASRPTDVIGPFVDDRRQMGVAVGEVRLVTAKGQQTVTTHLQENKPEGWHADMGWNGVAWTNGNALLPLDAQQVEGDMALLSLTIRAAGPYLAADTTKQAVQATSIA